MEDHCWNSEASNTCLQTEIFAFHFFCTQWCKLACRILIYFYSEYFASLFFRVLESQPNSRSPVTSSDLTSSDSSSRSSLQPISESITTNGIPEGRCSEVLYHTIPTLTTPRQRGFENIMGKGENASYNIFFLFPYVFLHFQTQLLLFQLNLYQTTEF